jgi:hypothetical protein
VDAELKSAREYATEIHRGRPYSNFGRFCWNWCLRAEKWAKEKRATRYAPPAERRIEDQAPARRLGRRELEAMLDDPSEQIRELAAEQLRALGGENKLGQD